MHGDASLPSTDALLDEAPCGWVLTTPDGTIHRVNQTFCRWLGYDSVELVKTKRLQDLLTMGGKIFHQTHWSPLLQIQGSISEVKLELVHRAGHHVPVMMNAIRRQHASGLFHEVAVLVAEERHQYERELVLARKRAEELLLREKEAQAELLVVQARLRLAIESAGLFIWDMEPASRQWRFDAHTATLLGLPGARELSHSDFVSCIEERDRDADALALQRAMAEPGTPYESVFRLNGHDGVVRTIRSLGRGIFNADGALAHFVGVLQDITEITRQHAEAEDRALFAEQMIGIVSHDLRNPLSAIQMSAHLLGRGELTPHQRRVLGRISHSTERAHRLIADLLDFTVARFGKGLTIAPARVALHEVVSESVAELAAAFPERRLIHATEGSGDCMVDADRLSQLIGNLVGNAMAYGSADGPVTVLSRIEREVFVVAVHNTGTPIAQADIATLFEPMVRGGHAGGSHKGVGLGLFIVRQIVEAHGGHMSATSTPEDGTRFIAVLPRNLAGVGSAGLALPGG